jgi:hypothetical protein
MSAATDLQRETTSCAERRLCDACVMKYSGLIRAASSAATGNHINRGRFFICRSASSNRESPLNQPGPAGRPRMRWLSRQGGGEISLPVHSEVCQSQ